MNYNRPQMNKLNKRQNSQPKYLYVEPKLNGNKN